MSDEKLLTIRDVALILGVTEKDVMNLAENGTIPGYKVGGVYLRFKRQEIDNYRKNFTSVAHREVAVEKYSLTDKISDFFYFNDFYIIATLIIVSIIVIIFRS